jgi:uncharacterized membrane protein YedE/YeeE
VNLIFAAFFSALIFGLGLGMSGMTLPANVIGFLDITGNWNPSLAFVMVGAIAVHSLSYRMITKRESPVLTTHFQIPKNRFVDRKLILGSVLFGAGWGIGGFCPGPAIVASVSGVPAVLLFLISMIVGVYMHQFVNKFSFFKGI